MSNAVVAAILLAAFLHAGWNALIKRSNHDTLFATIAVAGGAALISLCLLPWVRAPDAASWPYLAASTVPQIAYYVLIARIYRGSELGLAYPVMRGTAPLFVTAANAILFGELLSPLGFLGVLCISGGIFLIAGGRFGQRHAGATVAAAIAIAAVIACYTVIDGLGVRLSHSPAGYTLWVFLLSGAVMTGWGLVRHPRQMLRSVRTEFWIPLGGGGATLLSYGIALWAMTLAPVAAVAALRETSILFAALISVLVLKESPSWHRMAAMALLTLGAIAIRLS